MVKGKYIPEQGDVVYFDFSPTRGHEQGGVRPGIVVSHGIFNKASGMALTCPITSKQKFYPFEIYLEAGTVKGVALIDQVRSVDYNIRNFKFISRADVAVVEDIKARLATLFQ